MIILGAKCIVALVHLCEMCKLQLFWRARRHWAQLCRSWQNATRLSLRYISKSKNAATGVILQNKSHDCEAAKEVIISKGVTCPEISKIANQKGAVSCQRHIVCNAEVTESTPLSQLARTHFLFFLFLQKAERHRVPSTRQPHCKTGTSTATNLT